MKSKFILLVSLLICTCFSGCSWVEYFTIANLSEQTIYVSYTLTEPKGSFPIFNKSPDFYEATKKGNINWDKRLTKEISIDGGNSISMELSPHSIMIFGRLHNDSYKSHDQEFINGRYFNLNFIEIEVNLEVFHISKDTFDKNFKKENGYIKYAVE